MNARAPFDRCAQVAELQRALDAFAPGTTPIARLDALVAAGLDHLPLPGQGATLARWRALATVAASDLSLAKLFEGHTDALAIRAELGALDGNDDCAWTWGVWAAEAPQGRAIVAPAADGRVRLRGAKCWCSGAAGASHALLTAWLADEAEPQLVAVDLRQRGVRVSDAAWQAVGMAGSASLDVGFDDVDAELVGAPGDYLRRPGFWHGGAGVAACWFGGARAIADTLRRASVGDHAAPHPFRLAALGRADLALASTAALLRESAAWIDAHPNADARAVALRARLGAEACATQVLDEVGRTLGATPFCRDASFARMAADLPVFIRQSHAERDLAALGDAVRGASADRWAL